MTRQVSHYKVPIICMHILNAKGPDALELKSVQMRIDLLDWDTDYTLYFTVTSYKIGKENVNECEGYRYR